MVRRKPARALIATIALCGLFVATQRHAVAQTSQQYTDASRTVSPSTGNGLAAIDSAARNGKHLFIFFWKANDKQSQTMYGVFQAAMKKWGASTDSRRHSLHRWQ